MEDPRQMSIKMQKMTIFFSFFSHFLPFFAIFYHIYATIVDFHSIDPDLKIEKFFKIPKF